MYSPKKNRLKFILLTVFLVSAGLAAGAFFGAPHPAGGDAQDPSAVHQAAAKAGPSIDAKDARAQAAKGDPAAEDSAAENPAAEDPTEDPYQKLEQKLQESPADADYDGFVLKLNDQTCAQTIRRLDRAMAEGAHLRKLEYTPNTYTAESPEIIRACVNDEEIEYIEPDYQVELLEDGELQIPEEDSEAPASVQDPYREKQYNLDMMNVPAVWKRGFEGQDTDSVIDMDQDGDPGNDPIVVAVIDSGLKEGHEDIDWTRVIPGRSFLENPEYDSTDDENGHGTAVAGIIAAKKDNGICIAGLLQEVQIMPLRVFGSGKKAANSMAVDAINYAVDQQELYLSSHGMQGADVAVINMSFGTDGEDEAMKEACERAVNAGILLVSAAGNDGNTTPQYPAQYTMGVGSINKNGNVAYTSQRLSDTNGDGYANKVWVTAPGEQIYSLDSSRSACACRNGTSFSTPEVAALGALCKSIQNNMTQDEFMTLLKDTAVPKESQSGEEKRMQDPGYGWGTVDFRVTIGQLIGEEIPDGDETFETKEEETAVTEPEDEKKEDIGEMLKPDTPAAKKTVKTLKVTGFQAKAGKKKITLKWNRTKGAAGYMVYYSANRNLKKAKTKKLGAKAAGCTIKKLKKKKVYYVAVRPIVKKGSGDTSRRSAIKRIQTKK